MSNQQKQPDDPPTEGSGPADNPPGQGQNGVAHGQHGQESTALPTSDRERTETATNHMGSGDKS